MKEQKKYDRQYDSHLEFYQDCYSHTITSTRHIGHLGAVMMRCDQESGDWSDAPSKDLIICRLRSEYCHASFNLGTKHFNGMMIKNDFIVVSPNIATEIEVYNPHKIDVLAVPYRKLHDMLCGIPLPKDGNFHHLHSMPNKDFVMNTLLSKVWQNILDDNLYGTLCEDQLLIQIAMRLLQLRGDTGILFRGGLPLSKIHRIVDMMHAAIKDDISLSDLAKEADLSVYHLIRSFKHSTGMTPYEYFTWLRISKAKMLLEDSSPIGDVAASVGYSSTQALAKVFNRHVGCSPRDYRKKFNKKH